MSVKHIECLKVKPAKILVVEIRPVRCILDTPEGIKHTAKWMDYSHWKELRSLLSEVVSEYEERNTNLRVTQEVECHRPVAKNGSTIKIGYMFTKYKKCSCHFLTPRKGETWTDDEEDENDLNLRDNGGVYYNLEPCGEMLVVSVSMSLAEESGSKQQGSDNTGLDISFDISPSPSTISRAVDRQLIKTLGSSLPFTNTISDYFVSNHETGEKKSNQTHKVRKQGLSKAKNTLKKRKEQPASSENSDSENENPNNKQDMLCFLSLDIEEASYPLSVRSYSSKQKSPILKESHSSSVGINKSHKISDATWPYSATSAQGAYEHNLKDDGIASQSSNPVLRMMNRKDLQQQCQSEVDNDKEMARRKRVSTRQSIMYEYENYSQMDIQYQYDFLPDLNNCELSVNTTSPKNVMCKALEKKEKLYKLFGDGDSSESVANNDKDQWTSDIYKDEEYIPRRICRRKSVDLFENSSLIDSDTENRTSDMQVENSSINLSSNLDHNTGSAFTYNEMEANTLKDFSKPKGKLQKKNSTHGMDLRISRRKQKDQSYINSDAQKKLLCFGQKKVENKLIDKCMSLPHCNATKKLKPKGKSKVYNIPANQPKVTNWTTSKASTSVGNADRLKKQFKVCSLKSETGNTFEGQESVNQGFTIASSETGNTFEEQESVNEAFAITYKQSKMEEPNAKDNVTMKRSTKKDDGEVRSDTLDLTSRDVLSDLAPIIPQFLQGDDMGNEAGCEKEPSMDATSHKLKLSYEKLKTMTIEDLQTRLDENVPYLKSVLRGKQPNERHQMFCAGHPMLYQFTHEFISIYGPFSEDQILYVQDSLVEKFENDIKKFSHPSLVYDYIWRVLAPTFLTKIVMDNEIVSQEEAVSLLWKFSVDPSIKRF
ncbi:hypothetical protein Pcinc_005429 [Petrolisthes cinctipes]|uniref:Uncharacterized protein n=1 Tax=Petrolisthes cinctipes TaxID=88211 RepID=A0AAE1L055_PETCI|nr:hypothetical protein Pcinc_005429 [Petrolisthes cinctipes]